MRKNRSNIFRDIYYQPYDDTTRLKLYSSSKASVEMIQRMTLLKKLKVHNGCVNSVCWNSTGNLILSGSDDQHLVLTHAFNYEVLAHYKTSHRANIFSAKFLPNSGDHRIVSCSGDGIILYTDLLRRTGTFHNQFTCHTGTTYQVATIPGEPHSFLSCGEDGTVRWFDLRVKDKCNATRCTEDVLIPCQRAVTAMSVNPVLPHQISVGCSDSTVRTYDRRMLGTAATGWSDAAGPVTPLCSFTVPEFEGNSYRITSLSHSPDGQDVLVSYSSDHIYLFSVKDKASVRLRKDISAGKGKGKKERARSYLPVRRLRLRGDWSDTGPDARPERESGLRSGIEVAQARPILHTSLMRRMTDVLSRMLRDPATRASLTNGGEDSLEGDIEQQEGSQNPGESTGESSEQTNNELAEAERTERSHSYTEAAEDPNSTPSSNSCEDAPESQSSVSIETESSQPETSKCSTLNEENPAQGDSRNDNEASSSGMSNTQNGSIMENLHDTLTTMRDGYIERHGSEPTVKLMYSDKSSTRATISLDVPTEMIRDPYLAGPSGSSKSGENSRDSSNNSSRNDKREKTDNNALYDSDDDTTLGDSDDDDEESRERLLRAVRSEMEEAVGSEQAVQGQDNVYDSNMSDLYVNQKQKYTGHRNARTMIKEATFWGDEFVMSGSDCGHVFVWERDTANLCMLLEADQHVVNCVQPHPFLPLLATAGIDYDVKLWAPINDEPSFDEKFAEDLQKRNAVMLEETRDTITVPAVVMIRMLGYLNYLRRGRRRIRGRSGDEANKTDETRRSGGG